MRYEEGVLKQDEKDAARSGGFKFGWNGRKYALPQVPRLRAPIKDV